VVEPIAMKPGSCKKTDYEYERKGTCSIFMFCEPLGEWRHVYAYDHRTKIDWANGVEELLTVHYPDAKKVKLVMDNLNTYTISSLYEAFEPEKARSLARRLEIHYTPIHGSWLNIAEIELSALSKQSLRNRVDNIDSLNDILSIWERDRNHAQKGVDWQFKRLTRGSSSGIFTLPSSFDFYHLLVCTLYYSLILMFFCFYRFECLFFSFVLCFCYVMSLFFWLFMHFFSNLIFFELCKRNRKKRIENRKKD